MNERIDQLWGQALDAAVPETYTRLSYNQVLKIKQVFAELIVQECARVNRNAIESMNKISGKESDNTSFWLEEALKEHFGVEE